MKIPRGLLIWSTLAVCGVIVLGAMTWLTRGVLASERERNQAQARADLEECTRLALWRMDAAGAAIVSAENRHPPADYEMGSTAFLTTPDALAKLHFELRENGRLSSPEMAAAVTTLPALRTLLGANPIPGDEWSLLKCAADTSETNWSNLPKDAPLAKSNVISQRVQLNRADNRGNQAYQEDFNGAEKAQRAKTVEETVANSSYAQLTQTAIQAPIPVITDLGAMRAIRIGGELFLLRQFSSTLTGAIEKGVQGVWLDEELLKGRLLAEVGDLLPIAGLASAPDSAGDPLALVSFPFRLVRNEGIPPVRSPINGPLAVGWAAVVLALLTASLLVRGVMRLSERRASFVSAVTHELRTPLTTFRLYSDMLESGAVKPEKRGDYLRVLSREADRLSHLVENVLSFSKIERGSARSVIRETTASDLLEPMRERLEARLATARMTLEMDISSKLPVRVDSAAVEHILFNLIDNAAKYAASGDPPKVEIRIASVGKFARIIVSDHGPGIPPNERGRIFRAFHKSAREAAESRPGVGLGLALSRRLANELGGRLECVDAERGACFVLRLPLA